MTITLTDITIKFDIDDAADQQFKINVTGNDFKDIGQQVRNFAESAKKQLGARRYEAKVGQTSVTDIGGFFKVGNPNSEQ